MRIAMVTTVLAALLCSNTLLAYDPKPAIPAGADAAVAVVDDFGAALATADFTRITALLAPDVLILESGGAERSREQYLSHHAGADAAFLQGARVQQTSRRVRKNGNLAWVGTESEVRKVDQGKPINLRSTETMVLERKAGSWKIVHIHWSSRPIKASTAGKQD